MNIISDPKWQQSLCFQTQMVVLGTEVGLVELNFKQQSETIIAEYQTAIFQSICISVSHISLSPKVNGMFWINSSSN